MIQQLFQGNNPELVLFDLDGTLVDSVPDLAAAIDQMRVTLGCAPAGVDKVRHWVGNGAQVLVERALADVQKTASDKVSFDQAFPLFLAAYAEQSTLQTQLYPGVPECLEGLKARHIKLAVVTNKPLEFTHPILSALGLDSFFKVVMGGDSLPQKKPSPEPLLHAMALSGTVPERTLMVGDSKHDIAAARAAGCPVVAVPYGYNHGEPVAQYQPDLLVNSLDLLL
ncbi:MAG: phosphoglycolate phosphatase [Pontibacterium sp.]